MASVDFCCRNVYYKHFLSRGGVTYITSTYGKFLNLNLIWQIIVKTQKARLSVANLDQQGLQAITYSKVFDIYFFSNFCMMLADLLFPKRFTLCFQVLPHISYISVKKKLSRK